MENFNELYHYGIKNQKWGVRRYQYKNGHRTPAGKKRYPDWPPKDTLAERVKRAKMAGRRIVRGNAGTKISEMPENRVASGKEYVASVKNHHV